MKIARRICETSKSVVHLGKATFYAQLNLERREAYKYVEDFIFDFLLQGFVLITKCLAYKGEVVGSNCVLHLN